MKKHSLIKIKEKSFTLIELVIYLALAGIFLVGLVTFAWTISGNYQKQIVIQRIRENGSFALNIMNQQMKAANGVVVAGSVFNTHPGVLKLTTAIPPSTCGNGTIESGEYCDGSNLNGQTCQSFALLGGTLKCNAACRFDISSCTAYPLSRKKIVVTNNSTTSLSNYQVLISRVNKEEGMASDFSNLIFLDRDSLTQPAYWIEDKGTDWARIWLKIPSLPASSQKIIYLYYGQTGVSGAGANPLLVMDQAENFESATTFANTLFYVNISYANLTGGYCDSTSCVAITSPGRSSNKNIRIQKGAEDAQYGCTTAQITYNAGILSSSQGRVFKFITENKKTTEFWMKSEIKTRTGAGGSGYAVVYFLSPYGNILGYLGIRTIDNVNYQLVYTDGNQEYQVSSITNYGGWYKFIVSFNLDTRKWQFQVLDNNYTSLYSKSNLTAPSSWYSGTIVGTRAQDIFLKMTPNSCGQTYFDLFFSHQYTAIEPTVAIFDDCLTSWPAGISSGEIIFDTFVKNINRGGQSVTIRKLRVGEDVCSATEITSDAVNVKSFILKNLTPVGADKENIQINLTLESVNPGQTKQYQGEINWQTSVGFRL